MLTLTKILHHLYKAAGVLAAIALVVMMLLVIAQILVRQFNAHIPSSGDIIGFLVVWASFLGLAYTMHRQKHIRVEIVLSRLSSHHRHSLNVVVGLIAAVILAVFSYYIILLILESYQYGDKTDGEIALPLWLMQLPMGVGCVLFTLSMVDFTWAQYVAGKSEPRITQKG